MHLCEHISFIESNIPVLTNKVAAEKVIAASSKLHLSSYLSHLATPVLAAIIPREI
jgi:hypothetical protein